MIAAQCLGLPSSEIAAFSGRDEGPAHLMFRAYFRAEARRYRTLARSIERIAPAIAAGYRDKGRAAMRFAIQHHRCHQIKGR